MSGGWLLGKTSSASYARMGSPSLPVSRQASAQVPCLRSVILQLPSLVAETDQRANHEGEHEDGQPASQHEEGPCHPDHPM